MRPNLGGTPKALAIRGAAPDYTRALAAGPDSATQDPARVMTRVREHGFFESINVPGELLFGTTLFRKKQKMEAGVGIEPAYAELQSAT